MMKAIPKSILTSAMFLTLSATVFAGAGHDGGHHGRATAGHQGKAAEVTRTLNIKMMNNYYEPESIEVNQGETLRLRITNGGKLVHEFNIGTPSMHHGHQKEMMMMVSHGIIQGGKLNREMMAMDMGNGKTMKHDDPNSVLLAPGESGEIIWTFTSNDELEFACNVPGHYQAGMVGTFDGS